MDITRSCRESAGVPRHPKEIATMSVNGYAGREGVLRYLKVGRRVLERLLLERRDLEPRVRIGNRRAFSPDEIAAIEQALRERAKARRTRRRAG